MAPPAIGAVSAGSSGGARWGSASSRYLPGIDLIRAVAAVGVAVSHLIETGMPEVMQRVAVANNILGRWGVGIFFLVSGFCIHAPLVRQEMDGRAAPLNLREFYRRRFLRLYPAHLIALLLSIGVAALWPLPLSGAPPGAGPERTLLSVVTLPQLCAHLLMVHSFSWSSIYTANSVLWTLAIETHFYLAYPLFLHLRRRFGTGRVLLALWAISALITLGHRFLATPPWDLVYVSAPYRWWEWILGSLLAERVLVSPPRARISWLTVTAASAITFLIAANLPSVSGVAALHTMTQPLLFAGVITLAAWVPASGPGHVPGWIIRIGRASYSLYLVHPIAYHVAIVALLALGASHFGVVLGEVVAVIGVTWCYYRFVERPFMTRAIGAKTLPAATAAPAPGP